jgi:hypothetical protein
VEFIFLSLVFLALPVIVFLVPIASWVYATRTRRRLEEVERRLAEHTSALERMEARLAQWRREAAAAGAVTPSTPAGAAQPGAPAAAAAPPAPPVTPPAAAAPPVARPAPPPAPAAPARPTAPPAAPVASPRPVPILPPPAAPPAAAPALAADAPRAAEGAPAAPARPRSDAATSPAGPPRPPQPPAAPPRPPQPPRAPRPAFDWERLVGVKAFSALAGIALVFGAVFFLRDAIDKGWLQPPVRVAIGIVAALALLAICEMKAARRYPVTANALDAAAIAILFATFFAAHALWGLIPSLVTFALLAVVTALAVLLSIRRESLFIAVLGLLGGFATPALLSTGENRPIPLFAYLMLLNIGLAWVAYRQRWALLTTLTLVLTTVYQWGWVFKFLSQSQLTLAMGIFLAFPIVSLAALLLARRTAPAGASGDEATFERTAMLAAAMPLLFALYLAAVPGYGERPWLLFGFLLIVDAGLLAIALARRQYGLHAVGATAALLVMVIWLATNYAPGAGTPALVSCAAFAAFYLLAPWLGARVGRPLAGPAADADYTAPLMLASLVALARIEPAFAEPRALFGTLLGVVLLIAWRAIVADRGGVYFVAAFFAVGVQAAWSATHLDVERLRIAIVIYTVFGLLSLLIPVVARRAGRPLQPAGASGVVLLASLGLLLFLSTGPVAPAALWGLALLLAIVNAGLFVESAAGGLPLLSVAGSIASWLVLARWWYGAAAAVGVLPSLTVLVGLALVTFGGHAWAHRRLARSQPSASLRDGLFLGLGGHLFLLLLAVNPAWSVPPWPWMGTLAVVTLAASAASLATRATALHAAGAVAAAVVVAGWTSAAGAAWTTVAVYAALATVAYALAWLPVARGAGDPGAAAAGAAVVLFVAEATVVLAMSTGGVPFPIVVGAHVINLSLLLALTAARGWPSVASWAVAPAAAAAFVQWQGSAPEAHWPQLFVLTAAIYLVFVAYPVLLGERARGERDPYLAAILASALFFVAGRHAMTAGGYGWMVGALPVVEGAVLALLLRHLLSLQPAGQRDTGRLALVGGASLAFVTVAIPLQLREQWITIGWALEGAALAWLFTRVRHRGLLYWGVALLAAVFVRLALNPDVLTYEPRGAMPIVNWYLYTYLTCAAAFLLAARWFTRTDEAIAWLPLRPSQGLAGGAVILLFLLVNIEIADYYAPGPTVMFRFGAGVSQDLTYTIAWLIFGMLLLGACIYLRNRPGRIAALALVAVTTFKCFLYDLGSLGGLYRVASLVGLAMSLALVSLALQKFVLTRSEEPVS